MFQWTTAASTRAAVLLLLLLLLVLLLLLLLLLLELLMVPRSMTAVARRAAVKRFCGVGGDGGDGGAVVFDMRSWSLEGRSRVKVVDELGARLH